jgi:hypothetical protein
VLGEAAFAFGRRVESGQGSRNRGVALLQLFIKCVFLARFCRVSPDGPVDVVAFVIDETSTPLSDRCAVFCKECGKPLWVGC